MRKIFTIILAVMLLAASCSCAAGAETKGTDGADQQAPAEEKPLVIDRTDYPDLYLARPYIQGEAVWMLQARLKELGYEITPSGIYDANTSYTVRLFQTAHGLDDDGQVDREVWEKMMVIESGEECLTEDSQSQQGRMLIIIDVEKRSLVLYEDDKIICEYPVAVGKSETPTPLGEWRIVQKSLNWGNGFGTRWMGLNVPWGIFGIHGTNKPYSIGTYASHGCIRMFNNDVEKLYPLVPQYCRVRIVKNGRIWRDGFQAKEMKKGSSGQNVVYVQSRLKELGIELDNADGRYGNMTELAVKYFQVWHGLQVTGTMNEETYRAMGMID